MSTGLLDETEQTTLLLAAENSRKRFTLKGEMLVGRDPACAIVIQSLHISRYHAKIITSERGTTIEDLNSANGTFVNGLRLDGRMSLSVGDLLCFDDHAFRILAQDSALAATPASPPRVNTPAPQSAEASQANRTVSDISENSVDPNLDTVRQYSPPASFVPETSAESSETQPEAGAELEALISSNEPGVDVTRALTYHEMKELLRQSGQEAMQDEEPRFMVETPPLQGKIIPLTPLDMDTRWKIGRDLTSKICLRDKSIEVDHAYISRNPSGFRLTATSAAKSYILNGQPLRDSYLHHDDIIELGRITLKFKTDVTRPVATKPEATGKTDAPAGDMQKMKWMMMGTAGFLAAVIVAVILLSPKG